MKRIARIPFAVLVLAGLSSVLAGGARAQDAGAQDADSKDDGSIQQVVIGVQGSSVDAEEERDGRFDRHNDTPNGFVLDYLRFARLFRDDKNYADLEAFDALQDDERYRLRLGFGDEVRVRYTFDSTPMVFGSRARTLLGRIQAGELRIGDFIQQRLENPDGNGVPFFLEPGGVEGDNLLVQGLANDLFTGVAPFDLENKRRTHDLGLAYSPSPSWSFGYDYQQHDSRGTQPLGSGSYQRITDVDGDGATDYDYFFSVRGLELPATVDYTTVNTSLWARYRKDRWFGSAKYTYSEFENDNPFLLYDNPFWFTPTLGSSGIRRGLWEEGRTSLPPSNDAWNLSLTAGVDLGDTTRLTASFSSGEHSQNDLFAPITTNPATIGTEDLNNDGVVNVLDDPTTTAILPQRSLDATSDITVMDLRLTSKPVDRVRINASWRSYEYDGGSSNVVVPARTEYIESQLKTDFKGTSLAFVPHFFERETLKVEGVFDLTKDLRLAAEWNRQSYDWNQYRSLTGNVSREVGNRAVEGTDDDTFRLSLFWDGPDWVDARVQYATSERDFDGTYEIAFSGELEEVRQFDIAKRDRDAYEARLDFYPREGIIVGVEARSWDDEYPDTIYGFLDGSSTGWTIDASFAIADNANLFLYAGESDAETNMHLRTKCSNCAAPPGADWSPPWGVPNYDWFPSYDDSDTSFGGALSYSSADGRHRFDLELDYVDATVEQRNTNPAPPRDLGKPDAPPVGVALAFDFPDQDNTFVTAEAKYQRRLSKRTTVGLLYIFEDWDLNDFQLQQIGAYGANFLAVDDATRYTLLDAWNGSFDAHVGQVFIKLDF